MIELDINKVLYQMGIKANVIDILSAKGERRMLKAQIEIDGKRYGKVGPYPNRVMLAMSLRREGFQAKAVVV